MKIGVTWEDAGLRRLYENLATLKDLRIDVGFGGASGRVRYASGISVAKLAAVHEFGGTLVGGRHGGRKWTSKFGGRWSATKGRLVQKTRRHKAGGTKIPGRSFMRSTLVAKESLIVGVARHGYNEVIAGRATALEAQSKIAKFLAGLMYRKLLSAAGWAQPLSAQTIKRKGSSTPLRDTDRLAEALTWRVYSRSSGSVVAEGRP